MKLLCETALMTPPDERARAIVRIDHPAIAVGGRLQHAGLLADEPRRQQCQQSLAQHQFDFVVERRGDVIAEARSVRTGELGRDQPAGVAHRFDHAWQNGSRV